MRRLRSSIGASVLRKLSQSLACQPISHLAHAAEGDESRVNNGSAARMRQGMKVSIFISVVGWLSVGSILGYQALKTHYTRVQHRQLVAMVKRTETVTPLPAKSQRSQVAPVEISIPSLDVSAPIQPVGLDRAGRMATIPNAGIVAWYAYGATPGAPGNAILAGHRDWNGTLGTFWQLGSLKPNDKVEIRFSNGTQKAFQVVSDHTYLASQVPQQVMSSTGSTRTTLITCAGDFVRSQGGYQSRAVAILKEVSS